MSVFTYGTVFEIYELNGKSRISYGIAVYADAKSDGTATIVASARDLTSDKSKINSLVDKCNRLELSPIHFYDVVEDFLTE